MCRAVDAAKAAGADVEPSIPFMRLYYAHALADVEEYERSIEQLSSLREAYRWFSSSDADYLESRGIPSVASLMVPAMKALIGMGESFDAVGWLRDLAALLDEPGKELVEGVIAQIAAGPGALPPTEEE